MAEVWEGRFRWTEGKGISRGEGPCRVQADPASLTIIPGQGSPLTWDWAEIRALDLGDWEGNLALVAGGVLHLSHFAKNWGPLVQASQDAWRERLAACQLLSRGEELGRFEARVQREGDHPVPSSPAQVRIFRDRLGVLPEDGPGCPLYFADLQRLRFDEAAHAFVLEEKEGRWFIGHLALKTTRFGRDLDQAWGKWKEENVRTLHSLWPQLDANLRERMVSSLCEGGLISLTDLAGIEECLPGQLIEKAAPKGSRPFFEALRGMVLPQNSFASFLLMNPEDLGPRRLEDTAEEAPESDPEFEQVEAPDAQAESDPATRVPLFSFLFRLTSPQGKSYWAWETTPGSGRATYLFRDGGAPPETTARRLNSALRRIAYRREPVYLPIDQLHADPRRRAFAFALDLVPEVAWLRGLFAGRAIHASLSAWQDQIQTLLQGGIKTP